MEAKQIKNSRKNDIFNNFPDNKNYNKRETVVLPNTF